MISKNLFIARLKDSRTSACCREITGHNCTEPIKLSNPSFHHPSERDGDTLKLTWPDCFDMSIDVTLPPSMSILSIIHLLLSDVVCKMFGTMVSHQICGMCLKCQLLSFSPQLPFSSQHLANHYWNYEIISFESGSISQWWFMKALW